MLNEKRFFFLDVNEIFIVVVGIRISIMRHRIKPICQTRAVTK